MKLNFLTTQRLLLISLFILLLTLGWGVIKYFIVPVVWAAIIAYMTWPIYSWLQRRLGEKPTLNATLMLTLIILILGIPLVSAIFMLQQEGKVLYTELHNQLTKGTIQIPPFIRDLPIIGSKLTSFLQEINQNPSDLTKNIVQWLQEHLSYGKFLLNELGQNLVKLFFVLFTLFFFYRDGPTILKQVSRAIERVIGERIHHYLDTISETTRAVVYGIGLTAVVQAILAGLSYFVAGVPNPMVLTLITFLLALIPFGTPVAYTSVAVWLLSKGLMIEAIGIMAWGICIVSSSDNVIRPLVISGKTQIPFLLIMFGVLGGIATFGLVGLFMGPVILAILLAIWREWIHETTESTDIEPIDSLFSDLNKDD